MRTISNLDQRTLFPGLSNGDNDKAVQLLLSGWAGFFRAKIFPMLDTSQVEEKYCGNNGRATMNLTTLLGLYVLQQYFDLTDEEALIRLAGDITFHLALHIDYMSDKNVYCCPKTYWTFKKKLNSTNNVEQIVNDIINKFISEFNVDTTCVRIDSTHLNSNMKNMRRAEIFHAVLKNFLRDLNKASEGDLALLDTELVQRYLKTQSSYEYFNQVKPSETRRKLEQMARDIFEILEVFEGREQVTGMKAYLLLKRVFGEQCKIVPVEGEGEETLVALKEPKEVRSDSLQNPSDPDAGYDAHKGKGYQAQIVETCSPNREPGAKHLDLVLLAVTEPANCSDSKALVPAMDALAENGIHPETCLADTTYGGDENQQELEKRGITLISPVSGKNIGDKNSSDAKEEADEVGEAEEASSSGEKPLTIADFETEENFAITACPEGQKAETRTTKSGGLRSNFSHAVCSACPRRGVCPVKIGKHTASITYTATTVRVARRRAKQESKEFKNLYRCRSGIEATNSQLKRKYKMKRLRVRGLTKVDIVVKLKVLSLNMYRVMRHLGVVRKS